MNQQNKYKIISLLAFVLLITIAVILFISVVAMAHSSGTSIATPFIMIALLVVFAVLLLIMYLNTCNRNILLANENEKIKKQNEHIKLARKQEEKEAQEAQAVEESKKTMGADYYVQKIIPDQKPGNQTLEKFCEKILINFSKEFEIVQGLFFVRKHNSSIFSIKGLYSYYSENKPVDFKLGEGLSGQVAKDKIILDVPDIPEDYLMVYSGLGKGSPNHLLIIPVIHKDKTIGIIELATFKSFEQETINMLNTLSEQLGDKIYEFIKPNKK